MTRRGDMHKPEGPRYSAQQFAPGVYGVYDRWCKEWVESSYCRCLSDAEKVADSLTTENGSPS